MISIEAARDGFNLMFGGRRLLAHSRRSPCVEIGWSELSFAQRRGAFRLARRKSSWRPLKSFKVVENGPDFTAIDFEGLLRMAIRLEDGALRLSFARFDAGVELFRLRFQAWPGERVYGGGARLSRLDLKGLALPLWAEDRQGGGEGALSRAVGALRGYGPRPLSSRCPIPAFVSSRGYWLVLDSSARSELDFRRRGRGVIESWAVPREIVVGTAPDAPALLASLGSAVGKQPRLPSWAYDGAILGVSGGLESAKAAAGAALAAGAKLSSLVLEDRRVGGLVLRPSRPAGGAGASAAAGADPAELAQAAAAFCDRGIRLLGRADPFVSREGPRFEEARDAGFLVKDSKGEPYFLPVEGGQAAMVDLTDPGAAAWLKASLKRDFLGAGLSGWLADCGEQLPADALLASGEDPRKAHNRWPLLWARLCREAIDEAGRQGDALFLMRSGWLGSTRYLPSLWIEPSRARDSRGGGLRGALLAALSLGLSGVGCCHVEAAPPSEKGRRGLEAAARILEQAAFSPLLRLRSGGQGRASDPDFLPRFARMSEAYAALKPYHLATAEEYQAGGLPAIRHPYVHYEGEAGLHLRAGQYLYGRDLLVAPAPGPGRESTELELPDDEWVHLWSSRRFRGGSVTVESPLGFPAVFYRAASGFAPLFDALRRTTRRA